MKAPRFALALLAAGTCLIAGAQDLSQKVTFSGPAMSAKRLLAELSKKAGYPLETSPQTANEVLIVHVADVSLGDLLRKVAEAAGAEWAKESGCYRLVRSAVLAQTQTRADIAARAAQIKAEIDKLTAATEKKGDGMPPAQAALHKLLKMIPAQEIAALAPGSRTVYSSYTTPMQRPLRGNVQQVLNTFVAEHNARATSQPEQPKPTPLPNGDFTIASLPGLSGPPINGPLGKALMIVQRFGAEPTLMVELKIFDGEGKAVGIGNAYVGAGDRDSKQSASPLAEDDIDFSLEAKEFSKILLGSRGGVQTAEMTFMFVRDYNMAVSIGGPMPDSTILSPEWRRKIIDPAQYEPLSLIASDALLEMAKAKGLNMVASLPDRLLMPFASRVASGRFRPSGLLAELPSMDMAASQGDGWLTISPRYQSESYASRLDRAVLGALLKKASADGLARLDDLAQYMLRAPLVVGGGHFEGRYISLICPSTASLEAVEQRQMLRFYGMLSTGQRQTLFGGGRIELGGVSPQQSTALRSLVYDSMGGPSIDRPRQDGPVTRSRISRISLGGGGEFFTSYSDDNLGDERTEALPNGVPGGGFLSMRVQQNAAVLASRSSGGGSRVFTAGDLGGHLASKSSAEFAQLSAGQPDFDRFRQLRLTDLNFDFSLSPVARLNKQLQDATFDAAAQIIPFDQLPAAFREEVERVRQVMAKRLGDIKFAPAIKIGKGDPPPRP